MGRCFLRQAGLYYFEFNIHVLHHLGCALAQASAPVTATLGQVRGWSRVAQGPFCNGSAAGNEGPDPFRQCLTKPSVKNGCPDSKERLQRAWESPEKWM